MRQNTGSGVLLAAIGLLVGVGAIVALGSDIPSQPQALQHLAAAYGVPTNR